ncbi:unnamed protein product [Linum trigynum]|uniref:Alliinase C-terminal domain-containing protein n=1 Tax=Linum trigynum TaxID=586398 RepID=A0AAV2FAJ1_9ROSI
MGGKKLDNTSSNGNGTNADDNNNNNSNNGAPPPATVRQSPVINLDRGDPSVFEPYWKKNGGKCTITISGHESLSYFSDPHSVCWYMEPELQEAIRRVHRIVGNARTEGYHVVVGTGSTVLFQAALYALSSSSAAVAQPMKVVCAAPYYSQYKEQVELLQSRLYEWGGDAKTYDDEDKTAPFIEVVTSPNNPDGSLREAMVANKTENGGKLIHDLAYYWPNYTPITRPADNDIMLFTLTKCTGHAGSRIGWALVKDVAVAQKMTSFMQITTIGVSKDSQLQAAKILQVVADDCESKAGAFGYGGDDADRTFFGECRKVMAGRWEKLREVVKGKDVFGLPKYPKRYCNFSGRYFQPAPAFGWLECKEGCDASALMKANNVLTRGGETFGASNRYTRITMIGREEEFDCFLERISGIHCVDEDKDKDKEGEEGLVVILDNNGDAHRGNGDSNGHGNWLHEVK